MFGSFEQFSMGRNDIAWVESSVTWNTRPACVDPTIVPPALPESWWIIDVTDIVQDFLNGSYENYGFQLYAFGDNASLAIASKEYSTTNWRPELVLDYIPVSIEYTTMGAIKAEFR